MSFESALLTPERPYDLDRVRTHLAGLPYAFVDPHGSGVFHLSGTAAAARHAADQRRADPDRFPPGVLVTLRPDGVLVDQRPLPDAQARGREFVAWLLQMG
ncbi:MAG TPA: hypothetical protein ENK10_00500, partial [Acidobacteria bacterium]|nr:hypothetical protein [Acidobacteriota bacterium]